MNQKGQILVESLVGITIAVIALTGVLTLLSNSLGVNKEIGRQFTATYLAAEGVEVIKGMIDSNYASGNAWNDGLSNGAYEVEYDSTSPDDTRFSSDNTEKSTRELFVNPSTGFHSYDGAGTMTTYIRTVQITNIDRGGDTTPDQIKVKSVVDWEGRGGEDQSVMIEDHFFDWRP